jgi:hypothetical protein
MKNAYVSKGKDFKIYPHKIEFMGAKDYTLFINVLVKNMIIEWYFTILFLSYFICIISKTNFYLPPNERPRISMFILY